MNAKHVRGPRHVVGLGSSFEEDSNPAGPTMPMHHFTDKPGYDGIRATLEWKFKASKPPGEHPFGAYFTTLGPGTKNLALRLRIPREKLEYVFVFVDVGDLARLRGQRGDFVLYFPGHYIVEDTRKIDSGEGPIVGDRLISGSHGR